MREHHLFLWEVFALAAFLGAPVFLAGAAAQSWFLLRGSTLGKLRSLTVVLLSTTVAIFLAVLLWSASGINGMEERWFMLFDFVNLPALLGTLVTTAPVTVIVLARRPRPSGT